MDSNNHAMSCGEIEREFLSQLNDNRYSEHSKTNYAAIFKRLDEYMQSKNIELYSKQIGDEFMAFAKDECHFSPKYLIHISVLVRRCNDIIAGRGYIYKQPTVKADAPACFHAILSGYAENLRKNGKRETSIELYVYYSTKFLNRVYENGITNVSELRPENIYETFNSLEPEGNLVSSLRSLLRFAHLAAYMTIDYSCIIPSIRRRQIIPSVYTAEEIDKMLGTVDRKTAIGKRNLAIILLALRIGIRTSDIAALTFENFDFEAETLNFIQIKTQLVQKLALLPEVSAAVRDYIDDARPESTSKQVFLIHNAPFYPIGKSAVYSAVSRAIQRAEIDCKQRKHGAHALRMTLASALVEDDVPFEAVRKILGQDSPEATKKYVLFKTDMLRRCALPVLPPSGNFAELLALGRRA